jgi:quercetin dioxygenase-like cupin family protein
MSRAAGLVLLATATLAQQQQTVEITAEPSHHQVLENEYVRVFNVTVAPKASTLVHRHNYDYLFVTLGESDVVSVRPGEKPVALQLKDGEVRFTPGHFAHAAVNNADRPFHNITIELLKPSANVHPCSLDRAEGALSESRLYCSDQWTAWLITLPPTARINKEASSSPAFFVAVSDLDLSFGGSDLQKTTIRRPGDITWLKPGTPYMVMNNHPQPGKYFLLEFHPEAPTRAGVARDGVKKP